MSFYFIKNISLVAAGFIGIFYSIEASSAVENHLKVAESMDNDWKLTKTIQGKESLPLILDPSDPLNKEIDAWLGTLGKRKKASITTYAPNLSAYSEKVAVNFLKDTVVINYFQGKFKGQYNVKLNENDLILKEKIEKRFRK